MIYKYGLKIYHSNTHIYKFQLELIELASTFSDEEETALKEIQKTIKIEQLQTNYDLLL